MDKLSASEALFGFTAWLTTRKEHVVAGSSCDCAVWVDLVKKFCDENGLSEPREEWGKNLKHPYEKPAITEERKLDVEKDLQTYRSLLEEAEENRKNLVELGIESLIKSYDNYINVLKQRIDLIEEVEKKHAEG